MDRSALWLTFSPRYTNQLVWLYPWPAYYSPSFNRSSICMRADSHTELPHNCLRPIMFFYFFYLFFGGVAFSVYFLYHFRFLFVWRIELHVVTSRLPSPFYGFLSFFYSLEVSLFPSIFCTITVFSWYGKYVVRFFLPDGVFLPCKHGLDFDKRFYLVNTEWILTKGRKTPSGRKKRTTYFPYQEKTVMVQKILGKSDTSKE